MDITPPTWDGILSAAGAVIGGAIGAGGAALGVFWQLRTERKRHETDAASFREGISTELAERAAQLIVARTAIGTAIESGYPPALEALTADTSITSPSLFRHADDRLYLLTERQRGALVALYNSVDSLARQRETTLGFTWQNSYVLPEQYRYLREACQSTCVFGAEALAELFGRDRHPSEARLRDAAYVDEQTRLGAQAAIKRHRDALIKSRVGPSDEGSIRGLD